jgi:hypothetical protein
MSEKQKAKEKILDLLAYVDKKTGGWCGIDIPELCKHTGFKFDNFLKSCLMELYKENKIVGRDGIRGKLIFLKKSCD